MTMTLQIMILGIILMTSMLILLIIFALCPNPKPQTMFNVCISNLAQKDQELGLCIPRKARAQYQLRGFPLKGDVEAGLCYRGYI